MSTQACSSSQTLIPRARSGQQGRWRSLLAATPLAIFALALRAGSRCAPAASVRRWRFAAHRQVKRAHQIRLRDDADQPALRIDDRDMVVPAF